MERTNRREEMLRLAFDILAKEGLEGLHARSVAAAVGVNHAAVHYYFPKRNDLLVAVASRAIDQFIQQWDQAVESARNQGRKLEAVLNLGHGLAQPENGWIKVYQSLWVASQTSPQLKEVLSHFWTGRVSALKELLRAAKDDNALVKGTDFADPDLILSALFGLASAVQLTGLTPQKSYDRLIDGLIK